MLRFQFFANRATRRKLHAWIHARTASNWHRVWNTQLELFDNIWIIDDELTLVMLGTQKNLKIECQLSTVPNVNCFSLSAHPTKSKWCFSWRDYYTLQWRIKFQKQYQGDQYHFNYKSQPTNEFEGSSMAWLVLPLASTNLSHLSAKLWCVSLALNKKGFVASKLISMPCHKRLTTACWAGANKA